LVGIVDYEKTFHDIDEFGIPLFLSESMPNK